MREESIQSRSGIIAGGNFITDYVKMLDHWPEQDTLASIRSESMCNGGGPYNILKNVAKLAPDVPRFACGLVGNDLNGDWIINDCAAAEIDTGQLRRTDDASTSYTDAMTVTTTGRRTFFHQRGANALLAPDHFDFANTNARVFVLGYLMLLDELDRIDGNGETGAAKVLKLAREAGLLAAVDCVSEKSNDFAKVVLAALNEADILFINEYEIGQVLGGTVGEDISSLVEAGKRLAEHCPRDSTQVVVHSINGAVAVNRAGAVSTQLAIGMPESKIIGASGAGDAFATGFLLGAHDSKTPNECLVQAVCAAAMSLTDATPSGGMKSMEECLALTEAFGFQE